MLQQITALPATLILYQMALPLISECACRLVKEYMDAVPVTAVTDVVEMLAGPAILHMVHSHAGADVACRVLALGTAKQRKKAIKAMKGVAAFSLAWHDTC